MTICSTPLQSSNLPSVLGPCFQDTWVDQGYEWLTNSLMNISRRSVVHFTFRVVTLELRTLTYSLFAR